MDNCDTLPMVPMHTLSVEAPVDTQPVEAPVEGKATDDQLRRMKTLILGEDDGEDDEREVPDAKQEAKLAHLTQPEPASTTHDADPQLTEQQPLSTQPGCPSKAEVERQLGAAAAELPPSMAEASEVELAPESLILETGAEEGDKCIEEAQDSQGLQAEPSPLPPNQKMPPHHMRTLTMKMASQAFHSSCDKISRP